MSKTTDSSPFFIRPARYSDLPRLLEIYAAARRAMAANGNPTQWSDRYPALDQLVEDIDRRQSFVLEAEGTPRAVFALVPGAEPTYAVIERGGWRSEAPYATLHRLASDGSRPGVFAAALRFARACSPHLRADTHADNKIMQHLLAQAGFVPTGVIHVEDGTPRLAYELLP